MMVKIEESLREETLELSSQALLTKQVKIPRTRLRRRQDQLQGNSSLMMITFEILNFLIQIVSI